MARARPSELETLKLPRVVVPLTAHLRRIWLGLVGLNVLCLLEPLVGVVWQASLFRLAGARAHWVHPALLGAGLWIVYAADRLLDARSSRRPDTLRHVFFARHASIISGVGVLVATLALTLALLTLDPSEWTSAGLVFVVALGYLLVVHPLAAAKPLKKALAASIYALGVGAFVWPHAVNEDAVLVGQLLFALLAGCNLAVISTLEIAASARQTRSVGLACAALGAGAFCLGVWSAGRFRPFAFGVSTASFALLLLLLPSSRHRELSHALADLALLIPLLPAT